LSTEFHLSSVDLIPAAGAGRMPGPPGAG
jgi:hypothetical protein